MSGPRIFAELDSRQADALFGRLERITSDLSPVMDAVGFAVAERVRLGFREAVDPWGFPWLPLSETTLELAEARNRPRNRERPLRDTSRMVNSITHQAGPDFAEVGTDVVYAATHQFGRADNRVYGKAPGPIPARPFLPIRGDSVDLPDEWAVEIREIVESFLEEAAR